MELKLGIKDVTKGFHHKEAFKEAIWKANDKEIKEMLTSRPKAADRWKDNKKQEITADS